MSKDLEFQQALLEFTQAGGKIETLTYYGPRFVEKTFPQRGYVASVGAKNVTLKDQGIRK